MSYRSTNVAKQHMVYINQGKCHYQTFRLINILMEDDMKNIPHQLLMTVTGSRAFMLPQSHLTDMHSTFICIFIATWTGLHIGFFKYDKVILFKWVKVL